jgi:hypothetical protein
MDQDNKKEAPLGAQDRQPDEAPAAPAEVKEDGEQLPPQYDAFMRVIRRGKL